MTGRIKPVIILIKNVQKCIDNISPIKGFLDRRLTGRIKPVIILIKRWKNCSDNFTVTRGEGGVYIVKIYKHTRKQWIKWYGEKCKLMEEAYTEVTPLEFYKDMFDGVIQSKSGDGTDRGNAMVDVIVYYQNRTDKPEKNERHYARKYIMNDDYEPLKYLKPIKDSREEARLCLCSPCTYYGKHKSNSMAHELVAVALDLDYLGIQQLKNVMKQIGNGSRIMPPNYIVNSGRGIHLYYLLEKPIPCYRYMLEQLTKFKAVLQDFIWNQTSSIYPEKPDHGAITQAFRMVGSETKLGSEYVVRAYKVREERWTIEQLYTWVMAKAPSFLKDCDLPQLRDPVEVYRKKHPLTMAEAKEKYPDWDPYAKKKKWTCKEDLYQWWIRQIKEKAVVGGRYYCILALAAYGSKCDIPMKQVERDALELFPHLEELTNDETNHFKKSDIKDALTFYRSNKAEVTYRLTRARISELSKIDIPPNKRRKKPLKRDDGTAFRAARAVQDIADPNGTWRNKAGRPKKSKIVEEWRKMHPDGKKAECIRDTGLDKKTVYKWWKPGVAEKHTNKYKLSELEQTASMVQEVPYGIKKRKTLPDAFVVEGDPNMMQQMMAYAAAGIRSVDILTEEEYAELLAEGYGDWLLKDKKGGENG